MKDCSIVTANYALGDGNARTIGIVGPKADGLRESRNNLAIASSRS